MRQEQMSTEWGLDKYLLMDTSEIPTVTESYSKWMQYHDISWTGGDDYYAMRRKAVAGDEGLVSKSEQLLAEIEDQVPISRGWRNVDDVVGSVPNVPAYLAGHPQCMRRRERADRDTAPLTVFVDLTSSAGINAHHVLRRGIAILALVRALVEHRAITLWAGVAQDVGSGSGTVAWQIDTAPLDLARAAYHIAHPAMSRRFGYGANRAFNGSGGGWPFNNFETQRKTAQVRLERLLGGEVLHVSPIFINDPSVADPIGWVKRTIAKYTGTQEDAQ